MIVVATDEEYKLARKRFKNHLIIKTGVGGINVIRKLKHFPKWLKIINFGYVGSNNIPIGTELRVGSCKLYHPNVEYDEPTSNSSRIKDYECNWNMLNQIEKKSYIQFQ